MALSSGRRATLPRHDGTMANPQRRSVHTRWNNRPPGRRVQTPSVVFAAQSPTAPPSCRRAAIRPTGNRNSSIPQLRTADAPPRRKPPHSARDRRSTRGPRDALRRAPRAAPPAHAPRPRGSRPPTAEPTAARQWSAKASPSARAVNGIRLARIERRAWPSGTASELAQAPAAPDARASPRRLSSRPSARPAACGSSQNIGTRGFIGEQPRQRRLELA